MFCLLADNSLIITYFWGQHTQSYTLSINIALLQVLLLPSHCIMFFCENLKTMNIVHFIIIMVFNFGSSCALQVKFFILNLKFDKAKSGVKLVQATDRNIRFNNLDYTSFRFKRIVWSMVSKAADRSSWLYLLTDSWDEVAT